MIIGIVGKPNVGKSAFFRSLTLADAQSGNFPFTTIEPNSAMGYVKVKDPALDFNKHSNPREGYVIGDYRFVPVEIIDVAGLVPKAHEGRGLGNKFLDDLRQADALIHVIDLSGATNDKGDVVEINSYNPANDIEFLEDELNHWYYNIISKHWENIEKKVKMQDMKIEIALGSVLSGLKISEKQIIWAVNELNLDKSNISDYVVSRSSRLIFMNNHSERNYRLIIPGFANRTLKPGQILNFSWHESDVLRITDEIGGTRGRILVEDKLLPFVFDGINQNLFVDGNNTLKFVAKSLNDRTTELETFEEIIGYKKYSNTITLRNFVNITDDDEIVLMGTVSDPSYPLFYVLNNDGVIGNSGLLKKIELDGNRFNKTIGGLREGVNFIRLITTEADNKNIFNGEKRVEVISDTIRPQFDITGIYFSSNVDSSKVVFREDNSFFMNENNIILNISTDACAT